MALTINRANGLVRGKYDQSVHRTASLTLRGILARRVP
jgi:hypothetical protein